MIEFQFATKLFICQMAQCLIKCEKNQNHAEFRMKRKYNLYKIHSI